MKITLVSFLMVLSSFAFSQVALNFYFVRFTDKNNNTYSLSQPQEFLTQKALDRRTAQNIALDNYDLPVSDFYIDSLRNMGLSIRSVSKWLNGVVVYTDNSTLINQLNGISFVAQVQKNVEKPFNKNKFEVDIKPISRTQKATSSLDYGLGELQIKQANGDYLHNLNYKGQGMLISVIDAGFNGVNVVPAFDSLFAQNRVVFTKDVINNSPNVYDFHSHGTMVLSVMAANIPGQFIGTAPSANYALIRTEEASSENLVEEYFLVTGFEIADSIGSDLVNVSLGYTEFDIPQHNHTWNQLTGRYSVASVAATRAASKGMILCVSAGNSGTDSWAKIGVPADADSILTAGSVDANGDYSSFSSIGPSADGRVKPDVATMGQQTVISSSSGDIVNGNGTSFSSPLLCGLVTCLKQASSDLMPQVVIQAVRESASQFQNPDQYLGYGIPNFAKALWTLNGVKVSNHNMEEWKGVYPNPYQDSFYFDLYVADSQFIDVEIFDISGRLVFQKNCSVDGWKLNTIHVNTPQILTSGVYYLKVTTAQSKYNQLIVRD